MAIRRRIFGATVIVALAVVVALISLRVHSRRGWIVERQTAVDSSLQSIAAQLKTFRQVTGRLPTTAEGLRVLVERPADVAEWTQLLESVPRDPWSRPFQYRVAPERPEGFALSSLGPDPTKDTDDVHFRRH